MFFDEVKEEKEDRAHQILPIKTIIPFLNKDPSLKIAQFFIRSILLETVHADVDLSESKNYFVQRKHGKQNKQKDTKKLEKLIYIWYLIEETNDGKKLKCQYCNNFELYFLPKNLNHPNVQNQWVKTLLPK